MNALYVTVSIPLLLVLAGFNHAHGLTTFGKSNTPPPQTVRGKSCVGQHNCTYVKGTTCLRGFCLCGDNSHPENGGCKALHKGPRHICTSDDECVDGADCLAPKNKNKTGSSNEVVEKICTCQEGLFEAGARCGGNSNFIVPTGLLLIITILSRSFN